MIGKAYVSVFPFFDIKTNRQSYKSRPVLIIGQADITDYVVLPISRVTNRSHLDSYYDVEVKPDNVPLMRLKETSYIRTHKQTIANEGSLTKEIVNFRKEYEELYLTIISRVEEFHKKIIENAI